MLSSSFFVAFVSDAFLFFQEAFVKNFTSGAVGTVVVWVHGHLLVANVGNLEATLCSENLQSHEVVEGIYEFQIFLKSFRSIRFKTYFLLVPSKLNSSSVLEQ